MPKARKDIIDLSATNTYHCISRCVRGAFLCGKDKISGKDFSHRRKMIVERMKFLSKYFSIDVCAFAVMSNHYHIVLAVNQEAAMAMTELQVAQFYTSIYKSGKSLVEPYFNDDLTAEGKILAQQIIRNWRERLCSISWFMRALNESIAKFANKEDGKKGHFWQERFTSQALLDDTALIACMAYVDLNPVRAGIASDLLESDFTSIQERLKAYIDSKSSSSSQIQQPEALCPFSTSKEENNTGIQFLLQDYLDLVDETGRKVRQDKKGFIKESKPRLLDILEISESYWFELSLGFESKFASFAGSPSNLAEYSKQRGKKYFKGGSMPKNH